MGFQIQIRLGKFIWTIQFNTSIDEQLSENDMNALIANAIAQSEEDPVDPKDRVKMGFQTTKEVD